MTFDPFVIKHAPWSISKTNTLALCSRQYNYRYVEKKKEQQKSGVSRVGVALHALLEKALGSPGGNCDLQQEFHDLHKQNELTQDEAIQVAKRIDAVKDFTDRIGAFKVKAQVQQEYIEHKLAIDANFNAVDFFSPDALLRGVLDHGLVTADNVLIVIDHKSGRKRPMKEHSVQFFAYMLLASAAFPSLQGIQCGINYIGAPKVDWFPKGNGDTGPWGVQEIQSQLRGWLVQYLNSVAPKIRNITEGTITPETGWQCEYCGYVDDCQEGRDVVQLRLAKREAKNI